MRNLTLATLIILGSLAAGCSTKPLGNYIEDLTRQLSSEERLLTICWPGGGLGHDKKPDLFINGKPAAELTIAYITEIVVPPTKNELVFQHASWQGNSLRITVDSTSERNANILFGVNLKSSFLVPTPWFFMVSQRGTWNVAPTTAEKIGEACENARRIRFRPKA